MIKLSVLLEERNGAEFPPMWLWFMSAEPAVHPRPPPTHCIIHLFSSTNRSWDFLPLSSLSAHHPAGRLQLRKDVPSSSDAQTGGSAAASTPADTPRLPESAVEEGEGGDPEGKVDGEAEQDAPKGASLAQETTPKQDGVCG